MQDKVFIYADNAATSPLNEKALEAMLPFLRSNFANASQPYVFSNEARKALRYSRETIAECIGAKPEEIYFTSGGSESNSWVINGGIEFETDIITSSIEHHSILRAVEHAGRLGYNVKILPVNRNGIVELHTLINSLDIPGALVNHIETDEIDLNIEKFDEKLFYINTIGCDVRGKLTDGNKIVILKGSNLRKDTTNTFEREEFRNKIIAEYCTETEDGFRCNSDLPPMSPSGASGLAQGRSSDGKRDWKDKNGIPLVEYL